MSYYVDRQKITFEFHKKTELIHCVANAKETEEVVFSVISNIYGLIVTLTVVTACIQNALETSFGYLVDICPKFYALISRVEIFTLT